MDGGGTHHHVAYGKQLACRAWIGLALAPRSLYVPADLDVSLSRNPSISRNGMACTVYVYITPK